LVEGQDPPTVLRSVINHLQRRAPEGSALEVIAMNDGSPPSSLAPNHPLVGAAEAVLKRETGKQAVQVRLGATVPITAIFKQDMGIDTLMFGYNLPDEDVHAPNEFYRLQSISDGARAWSQLLAELANYPPESFCAQAG
jgi:acetylornithine deacetylase/succinyl-diaminopimelate desuccinylase-like protein